MNPNLLHVQAHFLYVITTSNYLGKLNPACSTPFPFAKNPSLITLELATAASHVLLTFRIRHAAAVQPQPLVPLLFSPIVIRVKGRQLLVGIPNVHLER